ncbi:endonuclease/exonuclease/phosphatase family protein [Aquabacter sp. L1I39]|uniref:endonuclease/exonuclease/phosphatase family protein n=1 Tax=Aquabacter sp. L1I39 TaxID=2820278 RepID=UPI001ADA79F1|nr:endonuclease/exonuclease/phosphatase family protein [Aquabacter sp. L1I39]QTL02142.1 endonuclease/exonuclease/phosphatase family protein [Aquabacter sp. L1I39]
MTSVVTPPTSPHEPPRLRVVTYNVRRCLGLDGRYAPERIAQVIARTRADVVALQELDVNRLRSGAIDQALAIAAELRMSHHFHPAIRVLEELYGDAILSLHPMRLVRAGPLPGPRGRRWVEPRGALWVEVDVAGQPVQVLNAHFGLLPRERLDQARALLGPDWLGHPLCRGPAVLLGDFNARPASAAYRLLATQLRDAQRADGRPPAATFPSRWPLLRIDHVFLRGDLRVEGCEVVSGRATRLASDHLPLMVDLSLRAATDPERGAPELSAPIGPVPVSETTL